MTMTMMRVLVLALTLLLTPAWLPEVDGFMNMGQQCRPFKCPSPTLKPVPKKEFVFTANGCGTTGIPIKASVDFTECCNWHDACYSVCGMKKAKCEKRLTKCMKDQCAALPDESARRECDSMAQLFSIGAQMMACPAYQQAQEEACRCVPASKVDKANRDRLAHFLEANNAPAEDVTSSALDALLAKYTGDETKMFMRLLVKYPKAIKRDASKKNFMDDILRGAEGENDLDRTKFEEDDQIEVDEHIEL
ncbi:hypothetical protein Poli38472_007370 [Pythium oligandrum]|uniref:Phospholipase A2 n=1 Tax=Pythium oligandrum TaxID=41045 RepID=A0A8K1CAF1_PYTOL|nr:hypothetical protein Poli38472_007370 [Pythium oligandrum]|eukprot:TMW59225.1 hypothetical protein Poli38472_007370 [Pythium oligandrum]